MLAPADLASTCTSWTTSAIDIAGDDYSCFGGPGGGGSSSLPGALIRGGSFHDGPYAGVFDADARHDPSQSDFNFTGFRCAR
jgi:hypothetical protein